MAEASNTPNTNKVLNPAPYTHREVTANGIRFHLLDYGGKGNPTNKRTMLCLHGGGANAHWFDLVAGAFTPDHHVLALDLRGHGDSAWADPPIYTYDHYVDDVGKVIEALDLRDFVLMGHSMGGMVSLLHASSPVEQRAQRIKALIVIDSTLRITAAHVEGMNARGKHPGRAFATLDDYVARFKLRPVETMADQITLDYIARQSARQFEDGQWRHKIDRNAMATRTPRDGVPHWKDIKIPALLVKAALSRRLSPQIITDTQAICPHVELVEVSQSEHHITLDNPAEFTQVVRPFLDRL